MNVTCLIGPLVGVIGVVAVQRLGWAKGIPLFIVAVIGGYLVLPGPKLSLPIATNCAGFFYLFATQADADTKETWLDAHPECGVALMTRE